MKKYIFPLALVLCLFLCFPAPAEEDDLSIEEIIEYVDLDTEETGGVEWSFPVPLDRIDPDYVFLVNKDYLLDDKYVPDPLVTVPSKGSVLKASGSKMQLQDTCLEALGAMSEAAAEDGYKLYLKSAYRSYQTQKTMYYNRLEKNNGKDDGWVSKPGSSDHQTGLGCDVVPRSWRDKAMNEKMGKEPECIWMAEHCAEFGFILRYPEDKQDVTQINYEPWHMRYVGPEVAAYIMDRGLCLEEFTEELQLAIGDFLSRGGDLNLVSTLIQTPAE